tara:strand:+ start:901 stop:1545 length:645 start_codon:yes stop_codon:yes gene_type:complete
MTRARILADYVAGGTTAAEFDYLDGLTSTAVGINDTQTLANKTLASTTTFPAGHVIQTKSVTFNGIQTIGNGSDNGTTFVQITNFSIAMTLSSSNNKLIGYGTVCLSANERYSAMKLYKDGSIIVSASADGSRTPVLASGLANSSTGQDNLMMHNSSFAFEYLPGDTSSHTYTILAGNTNSVNKKTFINRGSEDENGAHSTRGVSTWILMEVEV